jgi:hypothetical protein
MDVQADVGHVVKVLAGDQPDDLADFALGIMARHAGEGVRVDLLVLPKLRRVVESRPLGIVTMMRTLQSAGASPKRLNGVLLQQCRARIEFGKGILYRTSLPIFARNFVQQRQQSVNRCYHMGFQAAKRTDRQSAQVLLQFANVVSTQADIVDQVSCALEVA